MIDSAPVVRFVTTPMADVVVLLQATKTASPSGDSVATTGVASFGAA
jgi:hypothetical protein